MLHGQLLDKVKESRSPTKGSELGRVRYGSAVTDGSDKAEIYFMFEDAKNFFPGMELDILSFKTFVNGKGASRLPVTRTGGGRGLGSARHGRDNRRGEDRCDITLGAR